MKTLTRPVCGILLVMVWTLLGIIGCRNTEPDFSEFAKGPTPLRSPSPEQGTGGTYEDRLTGGQVFEMYCNACHNRRTLAERPFSNYQNVAAHMRVRVNLTGKEYAKLLEFLRRWHDVPEPNPPLEPSPKRLTFSQPMNELRPELPNVAPPDGKKP